MNDRHAFALHNEVGFRCTDMGCMFPARPETWCTQTAARAAEDYEAMIEDRVYGGRDRDNERARQADIGANLPTGFVDQLAEEADRE